MPEPIRCPDKGALEIEHDGKQFGTYVCTAPAAHTLEQVMAPEYFGRMQTRSQQDRLLRVGDMIDIRPEDCSWYVRLMVRACLPTVDKLITAAIVPPVQFDIPGLPDGWSMEFMGTDRKWSIFYNDAEKGAMFKTPEEAAAAVEQMAGTVVAREARAKPGRKPKAAEPAKEPEPA